MENKRIQIRVTEEFKVALETESSKTGLSVSELIKKFVDEGLGRQRNDTNKAQISSELNKVMQSLENIDSLYKKI